MATHGLRRPAVLLLVASLAALLFIFSSASETARANTNAVGYPSSLSDTTPDANADITTILQLPAPTASFPWGGTVAGTPNGFGIATDTADLSPTPVDVPDGTVVGSLTSTVQLAINAAGFNACFIPVPVPFAMVDATVVGAGTTGAGTIGGSPADSIWPGNADGDADDFPDSVTLWPRFLNAHLANLNPGGTPPVPIARYHGQILVAPPSPTNLELVFFAPGSLPDFPASMGTLSVSYLEDSLAATTPSAISMTCTAPSPTNFVVTKISGSSAGRATLLGNINSPPAGGSLVQFDAATGFLIPIGDTEGCTTVPSGEQLDEPLDAIEIDVDVTGVVPPSVGDIIVVDAERMEIISIFGTTLTVDRGEGGSTAAIHSDGTDVFITYAGVDDDGDGTTDEGCGFLLRQNPSTAGSYAFSIDAITGRDTDNDGITNQLDKCVLKVDAHSHADIHAPYDPIGVVYPVSFTAGYNPYWPAFFAGPQPADPDDDNLASSCDPFPGSSVSFGFFGVDEDVLFEGGIFSNGQDNCPLIGNPSQANSDSSVVAINIGPDSDFMGDACDPNPLVSDGHAHSDFAIGVVCVGDTDGDGDGWCDSTEDSLGSKKDDPSNQVEDISFKRTCADGVDNDADDLDGHTLVPDGHDDGAGHHTDLNDSGCQQPVDHDFSFRPPQINGNDNPSCGTKPYTVVVRGEPGDTFTIGFLIDTTSQGLADGRTATITKIQSAGLVDGTDEVGFINHDTGGYPAVNTGAFGSLATDLELEAFATADIQLSPTSKSRPVQITVDWSCGPDTGGADFTMSVDVCHLEDPTLGLFPPLFPLGDDCGLVGADGAQDRNSGNDAPIVDNIDVRN